MDREQRKQYVIRTWTEILLIGLGYFLLVLFVMIASSLSIKLLSTVLPALIAKPIVDTVFFCFNYVMQRDFVFRTRKEKP